MIITVRRVRKGLFTISQFIAIIIIIAIHESFQYLQKYDKVQDLPKYDQVQDFMGFFITNRCRRTVCHSATRFVNF